MGHCIAVNYYYYWIYSIDTWCGMTPFRFVFSCSEFNGAKQPHQHHIMASLNLHCNRFANALRQMSEQSRREKLTKHSNEREEEKLIHWNTNSLKKNYLQIETLAHWGGGGNFALFSSINSSMLGASNKRRSSYLSSDRAYSRSSGAFHQ